MWFACSVPKTYSSLLWLFSAGSNPNKDVADNLILGWGASRSASGSILRRIVFILGLFAVGLFAAIPAHLHADTLLTTVRQIRQAPAEQVAHGVPVQLKAVVTYYNAPERNLYVADKTGPIFVVTTQAFSLRPGDRVLVRGVTEGSFLTDVTSNSISVIGKAALPTPEAATFPELMNGEADCSYVTVSGMVLSATLQQTVGPPFLLMQVRMGGGVIDVHVEDPTGLDLRKLLDSEVTLRGVAGGRFDGKFQLVGANLYLTSRRDLRVTTPAPINPATVPLTPIDKVLGSYNQVGRSPRVRIRGSVTLYEADSELVVENEGRAALVHTYQKDPLKIGQVVYASGFADLNDSTESLDYGEFTSTPETKLVKPQRVTWQDALSGKYALNLVSLGGRLIEQAQEPNQDTLFINSGGHVFSAVLRHQGNSGGMLPRYRAGSRVWVTGVCFVQTGGAWHGPVEFSLHLRSPQDVRVIALSSWWNVEHLIYISEVLGTIGLAALVWGGMLRRRIYEQTLQIRRSMRFEAERERRQAFLEKQRSNVLEAINSPMPLRDVLRMITALISQQMGGVECRCEFARGAEISVGGAKMAETADTREERRDILSSSGERLGELVLILSGGPETRFGTEVIDIGVNLAALAIDNRRLYERLILRSEYDQLTEVPNRFLLESRLCEALANARQHGHRLALVYIDLDRFKSVNDRFGHRVGDAYLQHVARRLKEKLRSQDTLARVGGDEFIALIPAVASRGEVEEIAWRLENCFDCPFQIDELSIEGSASVGFALYPDDGDDGEQLQRLADAAMYAGKQRASGLGLR